MIGLRSLLVFGLISACGPTASGTKLSATTVDSSKQKQLLADLSNDVILPSYAAMVSGAQKLDAAAQAFNAAPTDAKLADLRTAWMAARRPWERGEAYLFGPVESLGYDDNSDSWPVNKTDLLAVLNSSNALTDDYIQNSLNKNLKGFHVIEFLIFGEAASKTANKFTPREFSYLLGLTKNLVVNYQQLLASWDSGVQGQPAFKLTFTGAGDADNAVYPTVAAALGDVVGKMADIAHELHESKLAATGPDLIESQFALTSITDFVNNTTSIGIEYTNSYSGQPTGVSVSTLVASVNPALDQKVKAQIAASIADIQKIPQPFSTAVVNPAAAPLIKAARDQLTTLENTLTGEVAPLFN